MKNELNNKKADEIYPWDYSSQPLESFLYMYFDERHYANGVRYHYIQNEDIFLMRAPCPDFDKFILYRNVEISGGRPHQIIIQEGIKTVGELVDAINKISL